MLDVFRCNFLPYLLRQNLSLKLELTDSKGLDYPWNLLVRSGTLAHTQLSCRCLCNQNFTDRVISSVSLPSSRVKVYSTLLKLCKGYVVYDSLWCQLGFVLLWKSRWMGKIKASESQNDDLKRVSETEIQTVTIASTTL